MNFLVHSMGLVTLALLLTLPLLWWISERKQFARLGQALKITCGFAAVGFSVTWILLAIYAITNGHKDHLSTAPLLVLCPTSVISVGLDNASLLVGLLGWLIISITNAALYAMIGLVFGAVYSSLRKPAQATDLRPDN